MERMPMANDCPYGASACPKMEDAEERISRMEVTLNKILYLVAFIAGIVSVEFGIVII